MPWVRASSILPGVCGGLEISVGSTEVKICVGSTEVKICVGSKNVRICGGNMEVDVCGWYIGLTHSSGSSSHVQQHVVSLGKREA